MSSPVTRIALFLVGLVFFLPLLMINGGRGIFIPSTRWEAWALVAYLVTLAFAMGLVVLVHWSLVERGKPKGVPATPRRIMLRVATAFALIVLPVWVLGLVHGFFRAAVDGPVLERLEMAATFDSYHERVRRRSRSQWVVLKNPVHGTFRINVRQTPEELLPAEGASVTVLGRRTWIGDRYDEVVLTPGSPDRNPALPTNSW